jgi:hypothetical protein
MVISYRDYFGFEGFACLSAFPSLYPTASEKIAVRTLSAMVSLVLGVAKEK